MSKLFLFGVIAYIALIPACMTVPTPLPATPTLLATSIPSAVATQLAVPSLCKSGVALKGVSAYSLYDSIPPGWLAPPGCDPLYEITVETLVNCSSRNYIAYTGIGPIVTRGQITCDENSSPMITDLQTGEQVAPTDLKLPDAPLETSIPSPDSLYISQSPYFSYQIVPDAIQYSPDGQQILTKFGVGTIVVWNMMTYARLFEVPTRGVVSNTVYSPDGKKILTASNYGISLWDSTSGVELLQVTSVESRSVSYSPDGNSFASITFKEGNTCSLIIWDAHTGEKLKELAQVSSFTDLVKFSPDGHQILTVLETVVAVWDVETGKKLLELDNGWDIQNVQYSPDGQQLAVVSNNIRSSSGDWDYIYAVQIWKITTGELLFALKGHVNYILSADYSPDGRNIVTTSMDNTVRIWDAETGRELRELRWSGINYMINAIYGPDGTTLLTVPEGYSHVLIWNLNSRHFQKVD